MAQDDSVAIKTPQKEEALPRYLIPRK